MFKYLYLLIGLLALTACNVEENDEIEEDYARLFPLKEIEKHSPLAGEAIVKQGDVNVTRKTFLYEGTDTIKDKVDYTITLKYRLSEGNEDAGKSRYVLRFVNEKNELVSISSNPKTDFVAPEEYYAPDYLPQEGHPEMQANKEHTLRFKVKSGFQMFLCVNGAGPRNTGIRARIVAVAHDDGLTEPLVLQTEQHQVQEGQALLPQPFCKYIILP